MEQPHTKPFLPQPDQPSTVSPSAASVSAMLDNFYIPPATVNKILAAIEAGEIPGLKATYIP